MYLLQKQQAEKRTRHRDNKWTSRRATHSYHIGSPRRSIEGLGGDNLGVTRRAFAFRCRHNPD